MKKLSESIWTNINKRSEGNLKRKEDDINNLDRDGLYYYLTSIYKPTNVYIPIYVSEIFDMISVPFLLVHHQDCVHLDFKKNEVNIPYTSPYKVNGLFSKLTKEFSIRSDSDTKPSLYIISPKDGSEVTNTFFIEVIDFLINNIPDSFERGVKRIVNESIWANINKRSEGNLERKEDIPVKEQDYKYWWRNIPLENAPKYKKEELRLWDFLYDLIIWKIEKTMNIKTPETIRIYFKNEDAWYISIYHNTAHGSDNYTMECNGTHGYNPQKYSEMSMAEKRGIKYRQKKKKFYIYTNGHGKWTEYILTEEPTMNGKKGIPML